MRFALLFVLVFTFLLPFSDFANAQSNDDYIGIAPFNANASPPAPWGTGTYASGGRNVELRLFTNGLTADARWPVSNHNYPMLLAVAPALQSVQLGTSHGFSGPGLPIRAGHTLMGWGGSRHSSAPFIGGTPGSAAIAPSAIPNAHVSNPSTNPSTRWRQQNPANPTILQNHYPMFLMLGFNPDMTAHLRSYFWTIQTGMTDINLNADNRNSPTN